MMNSSNSKMYRRAPGGNRASAMVTAQKLISDEIKEMITNTTDAANLGQRYIYLVGQLRGAPDIGHTTCAIPHEVRDKLREITLESERILQQTQHSAKGYFNMNEYTQTGVFALNLETENMSNFYIRKLKGSGTNKVSIYDREKIFMGVVRLSVDLDEPTFPDILMNNVCDKEFKMIISMKRLTSQTLGLARTSSEIRSKFFGKDVEIGFIEMMLNRKLPQEVVKAVIIGLDDIENYVVCSSCTFGQIILYSMYNRFKNRVPEIPALNVTLLLLSTVAKIIRQINDPASLSVPLTMVARWFQNKTCFDCVLKMCLDYVQIEPLIVVPTGFPQSSVKVSRVLTAHPYILDKCNFGQHINTRSDPIQIDLQKEIASILNNKEIELISLFSNHTVLCCNSTTELIEITLNYEKCDTLIFPLTIKMYIHFLLGLDFIIQTIKTYIQTSTYAGTATWCENKAINPYQRSYDLDVIILQLLTMAHNGTDVSRGFLKMACCLILRRLVGIELKNFDSKNSGTWAPEIIRQLFINAMSYEDQSLCISIHETYLNSGHQGVLKTIEKYNCEISYKDEENEDEDLESYDHISGASYLPELSQPIDNRSVDELTSEFFSLGTSMEITPHRHNVNNVPLECSTPDSRLAICNETVVSGNKPMSRTGKNQSLTRSIFNNSSILENNHISPIRQEMRPTHNATEAVTMRPQSIVSRRYSDRNTFPSYMAPCNQRLNVTMPNQPIQIPIPMNQPPVFCPMGGNVYINPYLHGSVPLLPQGHYQPRPTNLQLHHNVVSQFGHDNLVQDNNNNPLYNSTYQPQMVYNSMNNLSTQSGSFARVEYTRSGAISYYTQPNM